MITLIISRKVRYLLWARSDGVQDEGFDQSDFESSGEATINI